MRWDWPKQTIFGFGREEVGYKKGDKVICGDCWRCCIAAILQIPAAEVPHFVQISEDTGRSCDALTQKWLNEHGHWIVWGDNQPFWIIRNHEDKIPPLPVISCGPTVRSKNADQTHAVVMDGDILLYDPHPSNAGLLAVTKRYLIVPHLKGLTKE